LPEFELRIAQPVSYPLCWLHYHLTETTDLYCCAVLCTWIFTFSDSKFGDQRFWRNGRNGRV